MRRRSRALSLLVWVVVLAALGVLWLTVGGTAVTAVLTAAAVITALGPFLPVWPLRWSQSGQESTADQVDAAADALTWAVRSQWEEESARRRLEDASRMPVRWEVQGGLGTSSLALAGLPRSGQVSRLITDFVTAPRRMIVVGEPGSGKTGMCVLLTLELLDRLATERVPVLLQLASWDPRESFRSWLERRLVEDYPFLAAESRYGTTSVAALVERHRVLPVLDGLDEMPESLRAAALEALDAERADRPFVLTCRTEEFWLARGADVSARTLVVRLLPLDTEDAGEYVLDAMSATRLEPWEPVLTVLAERPESPVARALTTPLTLFLARSAYERTGRPAELLDLPDIPAIETHLLDEFVRTAFRSPPAFGSVRGRSRRWPQADAERWLAFLAAHLRRLGTRDLAWWQLHLAVPRLVFLLTSTLIGLVVCGALGWLMFGLFGRPVLGVLFGAAVGLSGGLAFTRFDRERRPRRFVPRMLRRHELALALLLRDFSYGATGALVGGLIVAILYGPAYGLGIGVVFGFAFGMGRRFTEPTEPREAISPVGLLHTDRASVGYAALLGGLSGLLVGGFLGLLGRAEELGLVIDLPGLTQEALLGAGVGLVLGAGGLAMLVNVTSAWGRFVTTRLWLASRGVGPARLLTFLEDAHRLGVLRQVGAYYQFRHALLQDRLADRAEGVQPLPPGERARPR